ncbi:MAG: pyrrolysine--tRNA(Pyl) ligase large subunit [Peptococcaceae bacterium]|jgi:phenylalanyl-tRNA synthetase alpha chain|nr:pyrrolysine--tRNA(Pyl) ligase large subunit [Peptococcaceae bacterium]
MEFTSTQQERLWELGVSEEVVKEEFTEATQRNEAFKRLEKQQVSLGKARLQNLRETSRKPALCVLQETLTGALTQAGFVQVVTPLILAKQHLRKMSIDEEHPLNQQVFWLDNHHCLRPMLAPNLYYISKDLLNIWQEPVRIFEVGSCFRKESQGSRHLAEFTMLNLVEWGTPFEHREARIAELAALVMQSAGMEDYALETEDSVVYGSTLDVVCDGLEVGSSSQGPHPLDPAWGITTTWVGIGFGLERILLAKEKPNTIRAVGRSLTYLDGVRLNIK